MARTLISIAQLLIAVALLETGSGLQGVVVPLEARTMGFSNLAIGLLGSGYYGGFILGCLAVPALIHRVGHIRAFAGFSSLVAAGLLAHTLLMTDALWFGLRMVVGFGFAGLYIATESWLNDLAPTATRGRVLAAYMLVSWAALIAGKLAFGWAGPVDSVPLVLAAIAVSLAILPVAFTTMQAPGAQAGAPPVLGRLLAVSPVGVLGCLGVGVANGTFWTLAPLFAEAGGLDAMGVGLFMAVAILGSVFTQWPLGWWSDRVDRRKVIVFTCLFASISGVVLAGSFGRDAHVLQIAAFAFGASALPVYSLCVAHANDYAPNQAFIEVSSLLLLVFSLGAVIGPPVASLVMDMAGPAGVFLFTAGVHATLVVLVLIAISAGRAASQAEKGAFVAVPRTTQAVLALDPRAAGSGAPGDVATLGETEGEPPAVRDGAGFNGERGPEEKETPGDPPPA
ncbi:putative MFS-type transporter YcaD [wastewater metagenome]|uniref:Putative MFS-type transporter YcaD n=3 Tax=root TaxID=1 RepID=A0A5B8RC94_9ZZZZ|nr:MFS transporter [Arhodomonas aquaeolei]QEA06759.1 putative MFS-type transporter YcaD [uncultured organism]